MKLGFDLENRVRNVSLAPSQANALFPLFEAISNSIHAIELRFGADHLAKGEIHIHVGLDSSKENVTNITISDNGIGLKPEHFHSFCTSDTPQKLRMGGIRSRPSLLAKGIQVRRD